MAQFTGLSDKQWQLLEPMIPIYPHVRRRGHLPADPRCTLNSICWILSTDARWCDLPKGPQWGSRTASHRWLGTWLENGVLEKILGALQEIPAIAKMIDFERLSVDGFFSAGKGGGQDVEYGYKGKGMTSHILADGQGNPLRITVTGARGDERQQVKPLIKKIIRWIKPLISRGKTPLLEADKGYDAKERKVAVLAMKIFPMIPYRKGRLKEKNGTNYLEKKRWMVERAIA